MGDYKIEVTGENVEENFHVLLRGESKLPDNFEETLQGEFEKANTNPKRFLELYSQALKRKGVLGDLAEYSNLNGQTYLTTRTQTLSRSLVQMKQKFEELASEKAFWAGVSKDAKSQINEIREKMGLPPSEEEPPSVLSDKEKLEKLRAEQEALEKRKEELISQQEKERLIREEKEKILQEKLDRLFKEFETKYLNCPPKEFSDPESPASCDGCPGK